mmetsp:Transcript_7927/g.29337  ORF Transcript_7927/g.29337 Transcript_7927/m.29337 type:complete len:526 (+) Transcript_7927:102-1679(+)
MKFNSAPAHSSVHWTADVSSPSSPDAVSRSLPACGPPVSSIRPSGLSRAHQLLLLRHLKIPGLPSFLKIPGLPSFAGGKYTKDGGWVFDTVLFDGGRRDWWSIVTGRARVQRMMAKWRALKANNENPWKALCTLPLLAVSARGRGSLGQQTTVSASLEVDSLEALRREFKRQWGTKSPSDIETGTVTEADENDIGIEGTKAGPEKIRSRLVVRKNVSNHVVFAEHSTWLRCCDAAGRVYDLPRTFSTGVSSASPKGYLHYRIGINALWLPERKSIPMVGSELNVADAEALNSDLQDGSFHLGHEPGREALKRDVQAAVMWEEDFPLLRGRRGRKPLSPIVPPPGVYGGIGLGGLVRYALDRDELSRPLRCKGLASARLNLQLGTFERPFADLTSIGMRLDVGSEEVGAGADPLEGSQKALRGSRIHTAGHRTLRTIERQTSHTMLTTTVQQQLVGRLRAKADVCMNLGKTTEILGGNGLYSKLKHRHLNTVLSVDYVAPGGLFRGVVWYSPVQRQGMAEIRLLEV